ncbi:hypothetical protein [Clostridium septicum]|uniref:Uncharacterized protein n=1 Tax=Clostridium septicum TaxID=1504 RepID=A0A9N7JLI1_CLOSE|nr:hypothetical protein [Clostridium septicum]AYE34071.1 hypothetical protein CP523_06095 [Clostridium septicum]MDU1313537.1 hypothetical protein [Clostridium septicum]QAS59442.1 hypothetical protein EI377_00575 [Clostridium septicum]UEC21305.1 hypothetical protein LK444_02715 [Clostridium septicum]USS00651.1 hypothetical protein NH397_14385 [Clostridium septicum]
MKFKLEKNLRIVSELITYFHKLGTDDVHLDIKSEDDKSYFYISGEVLNLPQEELNNLNLILNTQRQHEIEHYYWNLGGESELDCELSLIGMMVDDVIITYENNILTLKILRKES